MIDEALLKEYSEKMKEAASLSNDDAEQGHVRADYLLCELLNKLGYGEIAELFEEVGKWYA